jgi:Leucine-rich repeat (LRR) protein
MNDLTKARELIKKCPDDPYHYLNLSRCKITDLKELPELFEYKHLTALNISENQISDISILSNLTGLQELYIRKNQVSDYSFLKKLTNLRHLDLGHNQIFNYRFLENLTELKSLVLNGNQISSISYLSNLTGLQKLDLGFNQITDISCLEKLTKLKSLTLSCNQISDIRCLENLTELQNLDLWYNQISDIRCLENLTGLQKLDLGSNKISDVSFLSNLIGLQELDLHENQISNISYLSNLTGLQELDLGSNKISNISFLANLTGLQELDIKNNKISNISFLVNLTGLQRLDLKNNNVQEISKSIFQLNMEIIMDKDGYMGLCLYDNPIESPPMEIINQGEESVLRYFEKIEKEGILDNIYEKDITTEKHLVPSEPLSDISSNKDVKNNRKKFQNRKANIQQPIKTISIFLASSEELKEDRKEFEIFINRENKEYIKKGIFLELVMWEDFIDRMSETRLQDEYNKAAVEADIFVSLFWTKVGKYTKEEFSKAHARFIKNKKPSVYTYFRNTPVNPKDLKRDNTDSIFDFKDELEKLGHFPTYYENINELTQHFGKQLPKLIDLL